MYHLFSSSVIGIESQGIKHKYVILFRLQVCIENGERTGIIR
jgi:hypothetical protein